MAGERSNDQASAGSELSHPADLDRLEVVAIKERKDLHRSIAQLKSQVEHVQRSLDPEKNARKYFTGASITAAILCFAAGYSFAGIFTE